MKSLLVSAFILLTACIVYIGCGSNSSPTTPGGTNSNPTPTLTPTPCVNFLGTPCNTNTVTLTPTITQTPYVCSTSYSFGRNFAQSQSIGIDNGSRASRFTLPVGGIVNELHAYVMTTNGASIQMGIYSNVASAPGTLISASGVQAAVVGANNLAIPATPLLPAGTYWIALAHSTGGTGAVIYENTSDATDGSSTSSIIPSTFSGSGPTSDSLSLWADYCVIGASPTPQPSATRTLTPTATITATVTNTQTLACANSYSFGENFAQSQSIGIDNGSRASRYTLPVAGIVSQLHAYVMTTNGASIQMGIYSNVSNAPGTLISGSGAQAAVVGINTIGIPSTPLLPAGTYWIALAHSTSGTGAVIYENTSDATDGSSTFSIIPSTFSGSGPTSDSLSLWADYCVPGTSPTPQPSATQTFTPTATITFTATYTQTLSCSNNFSFGRNFPQAQSIGIDNGSRASRYTLPVAGIVSQLHAYVVTTNSAGIQMGIYSNVSNAPGTLISGSGAQAAVVGDNAIGIPATPLLPAGTYWIALAHSTSGTGAVISENNTDATDGSSTFSIIPTGSFGGSGPTSDSLSLWADYCVPGSSPTPLPSVTWTPTFTPTSTFTFTPTQTPVCGSPTHLGITTNHTGQEFGGGYLLLTRFYMASTATITGLNVNFTNFAPSTSARMAIYTNTAAQPATLITQSNAQAAVTGWNYFQVPQVAVTGPATVWVAVVHNDYGSSTYIGNQSPAATTDGYEASYSFGPFPGTFPGGGGAWDNTLDVYLDKCP